MTITDARRLETAYECPEPGCVFVTTWAAARAAHQRKHDRAPTAAQSEGMPTTNTSDSAAPTSPPPAHTHSPRRDPPIRPRREPRPLQGLSEDDVRRIATEVAERCITNRQHRLMRGFGMVPLTGRLDFVQGKDGTLEARVDGHDLAKLLHITYAEGSRVSVLIADANVLEGQNPQREPPRGIRGHTYRPGDPYNDLRRNKPPREDAP